MIIGASLLIVMSYILIFSLCKSAKISEAMGKRIMDNIKE